MNTLLSTFAVSSCNGAVVNANRTTTTQQQQQQQHGNSGIVTNWAVESQQWQQQHQHPSPQQNTYLSTSAAIIITSCSKSKSSSAAYGRWLIDIKTYNPFHRKVFRRKRNGLFNSFLYYSIINTVTINY
uniref:Putative serine/threonine-protein kinase n=1 Tax=Anopheles darlingi TaxID=43151 RepID=A0A2M4D0C6_ANODA